MSAPKSKAAESLSDAELRRRREQIQRGLRRANTAAVVILLMVVGFCCAAILQGLRAEGNAREAKAARQRAEEQLWESKFSQVRSTRLSGVAGRRVGSLAAARAAAAIKVTPELRDEAIATLALTDVQDKGGLPSAPISGNESYAFSQSLELYAVGKASGEVTVHRFDRLERVIQLQGPGSFPAEIKFSPDDLRLGARFANGELSVWSLRSGARIFSCHAAPGRREGKSFDFSPAQARLAVGEGVNGLRIFDLATGQEIERLPLSGQVGAVVFQPQGRMLAAGLGTNLVLWNFGEGRIGPVLGLPGEALSLAWHPDGRRLAVACDRGTDIWLWDSRTSNHVILKGHLELVHSLCFSHRGDLLMSASWDGSTRLWQAGSGELALVTRSGFGQRFSADDERIGYTIENQSLGLWQVRPSAVYRELNLPLGSASYISSFDLSPDGQLLAVPNPEGVHVFDRGTGAPTAFAPHALNHSVAFTADSRGVVLVGSNKLHHWRIDRTGQETQLQSLDDVELEPEFSLDGGSVMRSAEQSLVIPSKDRVFGVDLREPTKWWKLGGQGRIGNINFAAVSADGHWLATSYWRDGMTMVWDMKTRQIVRRLGAIGGFAAFSPDNRWVLVGSPHRYNLWETGTWRLAWEMTRHSPGELVGRGAFSPDGRWVAVCVEVNQVQLLETGSGRHLATLEAPVPKNIGWLAFDPQGSTLAASTFDREIQLWELNKLRDGLAELGLDWAIEPPVASGAIAAARRRVPKGVYHWLVSATGAWYVLAGLGVAVGVFTGLYTLRYQQRLMRSYEEIETLVGRRNRELELAQAELLHSQKMKALGTLAAGIAHDFNNLLSVIRMGNQLIGRPGTSLADKAQSSAAIEQAVEQGKRVVRSMLGYSRDRPSTSFGCSVPEAVEDVVLLLSKQFLGGLTLTLELDRRTLPVACDRGRLEQILLNLLVNATEAMNGKGRLLIAVRGKAADAANGQFVLRPRAAQRYIEVVVADTGPGIEPSVRERIFEPFFSTKPQSAASGTGLGLSLTHSLAEKEGIGIQLESAPGQGTTFRLLVPGVEQTHIA